MKNKNLNHIYLIAGEASGDFLGAQLMAALKQKNPDMRFSGVGGALMEAQGLKSLFDMEELSVMGVVEILPKIFSLLARINQTAQDVTAQKPDMVITIDAPDFSFRVHKKLRAKMPHPPKLVHYVAPTVWAWRPKRAKKIAGFLDALICLFDFEPKYFTAEGLNAVAVGHPMMESGVVKAKPLEIGNEGTPKLGVFFGSRRGEIKRISPAILGALDKIIHEHPTLELVVPTLPHLVTAIEGLTKDLKCPVHIFSDPNKKWNVFKACDAAIAVSGTVGLELVAAGVPHVIAYKMSPATAAILRRVIKTPYAHLANIMAGREIIAELIQENCTAENIADKIDVLLCERDSREKELDEFEEIRRRIGGDVAPSDMAAEFLLSL